MTSKTPLYDAHLQSQAKMVDFHGWLMPLHYGSQVDEHHAVRQKSGMFDVSHMTVVDILGAGGRQFLRHLLTNDVDSLSHPGRALYSCMCNEHGGILDDLIVYQRGADNYRVVFNSATRDSDIAWIRQQSEGFAVGLQERSDLAMIAVQGPEAIHQTLSVLDAGQVDGLSTLTAFECVDIGELFFARTGYTGEDGFEIILPKEQINALWQSLLAAGVSPCGLGARDTLRMEAGLLLYGQDMDETVTPLESGLGWTVKWEPDDRDFIGKGAMLSQKRHGIKRKLIGLILEENGIMRHGQRVITEGMGDGVITSGGYSPTLKRSIALARVPAEAAQQAELKVDIRGKQLTARVTQPRFVKQGKPLIEV